LCALRRNDVDGGRLRVDEAYERGTYKTTKTGKVRYVPLPESLQAELAAWLKGRPAGAKVPVFARKSSEPLTVADLRDLVQTPTRALTGITDLTLRRARTTFGTLLQGDVADTQAMMGHASPETTLKYYKRPIPEREAVAVEELDARLTRRPKLTVIQGRKTGR
jgi:integrase